MKYSNLSGTKLVKQGFEFKFTHEDDHIEYDVYRKGPWEATVDHTNEEVLFYLHLEEGDVQINSIRHFRRIEKAIKSMTIKK